MFADATRLTLTDDKLQVPGGKAYKSGSTKCGSKTGIVQVKVNDKVITSNLRAIKLADQDLVTIAFAPKGAELPPPPTAGDLARLNPETEQIEPPTETTTPPAAGSEASTTTSAP